jgi:hypothetical protein
MRCQWIIRRTARPDANGQRRWDQAYQRVMTWMEEMVDAPAGVSRGLVVQEGDHEGGPLRARLDATPGAGTNG